MNDQSREVGWGVGICHRRSWALSRRKSQAQSIVSSSAHQQTPPQVTPTPLSLSLSLPPSAAPVNEQRRERPPSVLLVEALRTRQLGSKNYVPSFHSSTATVQSICLLLRVSADTRTGHTQNPHCQSALPPPSPSPRALRALDSLVIGEATPASAASASASTALAITPVLVPTALPTPPTPAAALVTTESVLQRNVAESVHIGQLLLLPGHAHATAIGAVSRLAGDRVEEVILGVVRCGVVWCGVVRCGVVWCGVVWCGVVWCREVW